MSYVVIESGSLSGAPRPLVRGALSGPLKLTIEHLGRVERSCALGGLDGLTSDEEAEARRKARDYVNTVVGKWRMEIDAAIKALPILPILPMAQLKGWLKDARAQLDSKVLPACMNLLDDNQLPISEVNKRLAEFVKGYHDQLSGQIKNTEAAALTRSMKGQLDEFLNALGDLSAALVEKIGRGAGKGLEAATKGLGTGAVVAMGLVGVGLLAYAWRAFR